MPADAALADPRVTPARPDLAAAHLKGLVQAARYVEPVARVVCVPVAPVSAEPDGNARLTTQFLFGERVAVYEAEGQWAWAQAEADGYVGYVPRSCLDDPEAVGGQAPTHRVAALSTHVYPEPQVKARAVGALSCGARVAVAATEAGFAVLAAGGCVPEAHLAPLDTPAADWVAEAERLRGVPYLWGGRSAAGIDCSGLVQLALQSAGRDCPRDSDQQEAAVGGTLESVRALRRGDLVFWKGHVGVMTSARQLLHANIHHMSTVEEPLATARRRIAAAGGGPVTRYARIA